MSDVLHPCQSCGACCAYFRVSFYWREAESEDNPGGVPIELTENTTDFKRSMRGTAEKHHARCVALEGRVGQQVACSIYTRRPSPCRDFAASFEEGVHRPRCDQARARYQLAPLRPHDWHAWHAAHPPDASAFAHSPAPDTIVPHEAL